MTPEQKKSLQSQLDEMKSFAASRAVDSNEGRELTTRLIRLTETLLDGKPSTPLQPRHHA